MADLIYNRSLRQLSWPAKGKQWVAKSGPWGAGVLPAGIYDVSRRELTQYTMSTRPAFKDKTGKGFFLPIYPKFNTNRGTNGRLGIHPDGNKPGTEGCIGLQDGNTRPFYDAIISIPVTTRLTLEVR